MKSNFFLYFILFCGILVLSLSVRAENIAPKEAEEFALAKGNELLEVFAIDDYEEKYEKLDNLLLEYVDLDYIAKFVIAKYWREMDAAQQKRYLELFKNYALNLYKGFPLNFKDKVSFSILGSEKVNDDTLVNAEIVLALDEEDTKVNAAFRLCKKNGKILMRDIKIGENSFILAYRQRFQEMMKEADEDVNWFMEDFEALVNSLDKNA
jgi:phospholipid transport system substrate-binding protein